MNIIETYSPTQANSHPKATQLLGELVLGLAPPNAKNPLRRRSYPPVQDDDSDEDEDDDEDLDHAALCDGCGARGHLQATCPHRSDLSGDEDDQSDAS